MLQSFFKIALRYLWRKRTYSLLNLICLTFGLTCAIITVLYIRNVLSYDRFHKNYNQLYSVEAWVTFFNGDRFPKEYLSASLVDMLKEQAPEIEKMTRISEREFSFISGDNVFTEKGFYADNNFFDLFTFKVSKAGSMNVLSEMNSIVISERMAIKFFNNTDCLEKTLILKGEDKNESYTVAGVFQNVQSQSVMQFDFVIPFSRFLEQNDWAMETGATACQTWVMLNENNDARLVEKKIMNLIKNQEATLNQELFLFPLKEKILYSYAGGKRVWNEMQNIIIVGSVGLTILLIACFNFINLAIALNLRRYLEAGIKKVSGSSRFTIIIQFLGETFIITLLSFLFAIFLVWFLLPGFNSLFNFDIHLRLLDFRLTGIFLVITLFTGFVSGLLPALYLASSNPVDALKGNKITGNSYSVFRQSLIVFQFAIPVVLIICMMIIKTQDSFMRNYDAGVDKEKVIVLDNSINIQNHAKEVKEDLLAIPGIEAISFTNCIPTRGATVTSEVDWNGKDATEKLHFWCINSDFDYNKVVRVNVVDGRFFDQEFSTDSTAYLVNDVAAGVMKNKSPVGSSIIVNGKRGTIIGVFRDFHSIDLAGPLVPTIIQIKSKDCPTTLVKYSSASFKTISGSIRDVYKQYDSEAYFQATMFRDLIPYSNLSLPSSLVGVAFIISLLMACLGFFGLASFTSGNRTKEIGIRKAHGARICSVMSMLLTSYARWLAIAFIISVPIAFILGKTFLGRFYFHTPMPLWAFFAGPFIAFSVAFLAVSSQTWRVAIRNPAEVLKNV